MDHSQCIGLSTINGRGNRSRHLAQESQRAPHPDDAVNRHRTAIVPNNTGPGVWVHNESSERAIYSRAQCPRKRLEGRLINPVETGREHWIGMGMDEHQTGAGLNSLADRSGDPLSRWPEHVFFLTLPGASGRPENLRDEETDAFLTLALVDQAAV